MRSILYVPTVHCAADMVDSHYEAWVSAMNSSGHSAEKIAKLQQVVGLGWARAAREVIDFVITARKEGRPAYVFPEGLPIGHPWTASVPFVRDRVARGSYQWKLVVALREKMACEIIGCESVAVHALGPGIGVYGPLAPFVRELRDRVALEAVRSALPDDAAVIVLFGDCHRLDVLLRELPETELTRSRAFAHVTRWLRRITPSWPSPSRTS